MLGKKLYFTIVKQIILSLSLSLSIYIYIYIYILPDKYVCVSVCIKSICPFDFWFRLVQLKF
jgi:hypothetical protein